MKKIVWLTLLWMMGVMSVEAQWSITPEAGMAITKRNSFGTSWEPRPKIGVGVEYQFPSSFFSLKSGLYYMQRGYSFGNDYYLSSYAYHYGYGDPQYGFGGIGKPGCGTTAPVPGMSGGYGGYGYGYGYYDYAYDYSNRLKRHFLQLPVMADFSFRLADEVRLHVAAGPYIAVSMADSGEGGPFYSGYISYNPTGGYGATGPGIVSGGCVVYPSGNSWLPTQGLRAFDWGVSGVLGLEVKQWMFNFAYDLSLGKEYKHGSIGVNYHTMSLSLGYKFKLGK